MPKVVLKLFDGQSSDYLLPQLYIFLNENYLYWISKEQNSYWVIPYIDLKHVTFKLYIQISEPKLYNFNYIIKLI